MRTRRHRCFLFALAALSIGGVCAHAQVGTPQALQGLTGQQSISAQGRETIRTYTGPLLAQLEGDDARARSAARDALMAPLVSGDSLTVSFRLTYTEALLPTLERLAAPGRPEAGAVNALRIAGELGTGQSLQLLTGAMADTRPGVRYAAAMGMRATLRLIASDTGAIPAQQAQQVVGTLEKAMRDETSTIVLDALVRAVEPVQGNAPLRIDAMTAMCRALNDQIARMRRQGAADMSDESATILRAVVMVRGVFIDVGTVPRPFSIEAAAMTGQAMAYAAGGVESRGGFASLSDEERPVVGALLKAAEAVAALANVSMGEPNIPSQPIAQAVDRTDTPALRRAVDEWIGDRGRLTRPPYARNPAEFR